MKKLLSIILCLAMVMSLVVAVSAAESTATLTATELGLENAAEFVETKIGSITFTPSAGTNEKNTPKFYANGNAVRFYAGNTLTITPDAGCTITKIEIAAESNDISSADVTVDNGTRDGIVITPVDGTKPVVITKNGTSGNFRVGVCTVTYTTEDSSTPVEPPVDEDPTPSTGITTGTYAIVAEHNGKAYAMGTELNGAGNKFVGYEVTVSDGTVSGTTVPAWTVTAVDGGITLSNANGYATHPGKTNVAYAAEAAVWAIEAQEDGSYHIISSTDSSRALAFRASKDGPIFGSYALANLTNGYGDEYSYGLKLYAVDGSTTTPDPKPEDPKPTWEHTATQVTELVNGAQIVLNNENVVVTGEEYTYDNGKGTVKQQIVLADALVEGTTLSYNNAVVLTVEINGEHVSFKTADGKYLYADGTDVKFVAEAGEHTLFVLEAAEGGHYIKCANADYTDKNGNVKPQYLEVYKGYLTCYSLNESKANIYTFRFFSVGGTTTPDPKPEDPKPEDPKPEDPKPEVPADTLVKVDAPATGTAFKLGYYQVALEKSLYFAGAMDGYYFATTEDESAAVDVFVEAVEGGYHLYFMDGETKTYLDIIPRDGTEDKVNVVLTTTPSAVFTWNAAASTFVVTGLQGADWYMGTYGTYKTISASKIDYITGDNAEKVDVSQFPAHLYAYGSPATGDFITVIIALMAVSCVGAAVLLKKKEF